jgi:hypothetical protein
LSQLNKLESYYTLGNKSEINEYDSILVELEDLNQLYYQNLNQYIQLQDENQCLNERLVDLNENLIKFVKSNSDNFDMVLFKYSLIRLAGHLKESKVYIEKLTTIKNKLLKQSNCFKLRDSLKICKTNIFSMAMFSVNLRATKTINVRTSQSLLNKTFILIENLHRVLDLDLSEWSLVREIHYPASMTMVKNYGLIRFQFPKNFVLKRRRKIYLLAKGFGNGNLTPKKDSEVLVVESVSDWGIGMSVVTKLINDKNIVKFVSVCCLNDIWFNE